MNAPLPDLGPQPDLETRRLWLTPFSMEDAPAVFAYASNPRVPQHTTWRTHESIEDAEDFIRMVQAYESGFCWAIRESRSGLAIGAIEFGFTDAATASVHYVLGEEHWNRGYMTEVVRAVVDWGLRRYAQIELIRTAATTANTGSRRVLEKCGFKLVDVARDRWEKFEDPVELAVYECSRPTG